MARSCTQCRKLATTCFASGSWGGLNGQLNEREAFVRRQLIQLVGNSKIACECLSLEPSQLRALVVLCKLMARLVSRSEQPLCERTVNKHTDLFFSQ